MLLRKKQFILSWAAIAAFYFFCAASLEKGPRLDLADDDKSFFDKLKEENISEARIYMDFDTVIGEKDKKEYANAIVVTLKNGEVMDSFPAEMRARGVMRNKFCRFPPLKLKLKKKPLNEAGLNDMNEIKIVVPCKSSSAFENYVIKEKLIYDLYEHVSPYSFRSQLMTVDYYDLNSKKKKEESVSIFVEHWEELAYRFNGKRVEREKGSEFLAQDQLAINLAVFQYMIGNTDFAYANMHNVGFIYVETNPKLTPVPFDFDYCGIVNTNYAIPNQNTTLTDVRQRLYQGICREDEMLLTAIEHFKKIEPQILETVDNYNALDEGDRGNIRKYIEGFFRIIKDQKKSLRAFTVKC